MHLSADGLVIAILKAVLLNYDKRVGSFYCNWGMAMQECKFCVDKQ